MDSFSEKKVALVDLFYQGTRLDIFLALKFPKYSRSFFKNLIVENKVFVNGTVQSKAGFVLSSQDEVVVYIPDILALKESKDVSAIDAQVIFEHADFLIINKGAGVLVHAPNDKCEEITLVDWLIEKFKEIVEVGSPERPGIVHRLDMDTSGIMVVPRTNYAHKLFGDMFKERRIQKTYLAIVEGHPPRSGCIDYNIVRHPDVKSRMTHVLKKDELLQKYSGSRQAKTEFEVLEYFKDYSLVQARPLTGRTHQIRVHLTSIGHPLLGDSVYGKQSKIISRHALHAKALEFEFGGQRFCFEQDAPEDFRSALSNLEPYV